MLAQGDLSQTQEDLELLVRHAYLNVPFYSKRLSCVSENGDIDLDHFHHVPLLTKNDIRHSRKELTSKDVSTRRWHYNTSGGSTGEPARFIQDDIFDRWTNVTTRYYYQNMLGIDELSVKKVLLWGSEKEIFDHTHGLRASIVNWLTNTTFLNSFRMTQKDMEQYVKIINNHRPDLLRGYAGSLYELSRFIAGKGISVHSPRVIVSAAEKLDRDRRQMIEQVFGTKAYDFYGSREVDGIAGQCKRGAMHIFMFNNYVELLADPSLKPSDTSRVVTTTLHNYSMPLVRYDIGDTAIAGTADCGCGDPLPTIKEIVGREIDHFLTDDGTLIYGDYFTHLFYYRDWVRTFQVVQEDLKRVRILAVVESANQREMREISEKVRLVMGRDCEVIWEIVDEIPTSSSGKHTYTRSLVSR
jgi:phenylacetate-CoA ligase